MITRAGLRDAARRLAPLYFILLFGLCAWDTLAVLRTGTFAFDFHGTIWQAGKDILHGRSPYPAPDAQSLAREGNPAVYPASTLVLTAPLALLPLHVAAILWDLGCAAALAAALRLAEVRDWRVFAVVFLSFPVAYGFVLAQFDPLLAFGCALAWRWRRRPGARFAICLGALVAAKILLWPLLVWAVAIGRRREAIVAAVGATIAVVAGWAVIGFAGFRAYPHLLMSLSTAFGTRGYSLMALGARIGLSVGAGRALTAAAAVGLCALCVALVQRGREPEALLAAVAAALLGSPLLWLHYTVILLVVLAIKRPAFTTAWLIPIGFWLSPTEKPTAFTFAAGFAFFVLLLLTALVPRRVQTFRGTYSAPSETTASA